MPNLAAVAASSFSFAIGLAALTAAVTELHPRPWRRRVPQRPLIAAAAALSAAAAALALASALGAVAVAGVALAAAGAAVHQHRATDADAGDDGPPGGDGGPGPEPPAGPDGIDWAVFERDFWRHVDAAGRHARPHR
jgi:hypothetical protein